MSNPTTSWTDSEIATLTDGINAGSSWAVIIAALPGRSNLAVRRKAATLGLAAQSESSPYPYIPDDSDTVTIGDDALLDALTAAHAPGTGELSIRAGRPVLSLARPGSALSHVGSPAAMAAGL